MKENCGGCGEPLDHDAEREQYDEKAIVYADDYAYHLGCEDQVFEEVYAEVDP